MPSFLNKVFGYKKHDDKEAARPTRDASDNTLLDGKYEAISPVLSAAFAEAQSTKDPDRDVGFSLFKPKSRGAAQKSAQKHPEAVPHLTLQLPGPKGNPDSRALGIVFEADPASQVVLDDAVIAAKRLSPLEALVLVRACAQAITERGLETLGIMHPHWLSASPDVQRKLISLFIRSLTPQSRITTLSPTPSSSVSAFENELHYTRSPHDVAAVLRWGLRHLVLQDGHFGKDNAEWSWYNSFFHAECNASYPPKAFSELLLPQLPAPHTELLTATLSLITSLASHAEANSISGSKLSKFLGLWLLLATRAEQSDDWNQFYARWERAGRILEHLFLARLREESFEHCLPTRLQELVKYYPYNQGSLSTAGDLLSRPRFSTRQCDTLFVRIETLLTHSSEQPKQHPIQLLLEAFHIPVENPSGDEHIAFWNTLKTTAFEEATSSDPEGPQFARIFVDDTIQLLSSIPADNSAPTSPALLTSPIAKVVSRKRSSSLTKVLERALPKSDATNGSTPVSPTSPSSAVITDWAQFSLSGFGDTPTAQPLAVLLGQDDDIEVTQPRMSRKSSRQRGKSRTRRRRSEDQEPLETPLSSQPEPEPSIIETKLGSVHVVQIDEAFIDFWSDAIVDPISANWPTFVVCGLKQIPSAEQPIRWLVIEQAYSRQQPQPPRVPSPDGHRGRSPRPSFRSDISGFRINTMFSSARKRFSVFSKSATDLDPKRSGGKYPITGELGEILVEEEPTLPSAPPTQVDHHVNGNAPVAAVVASRATAGAADQLKADEIFTAPIAAAPSADLIPTLKEESDPIQVAVEAPSVEPTPQSGGCNSSSEVPRLPVKASEEAVSLEQGSSRTPDAINPKVDNTTNPVAKVAPLAADTHSWSIQDTSDPTVLTSGPVLTAESPIAEIQTEQRVAIEAEDRPVDLVAQPARSAGGPSNVVQVDIADGLREVAEAVAIPSALETVAIAVETPVVAAVHDEAPEPTAEAPHVVEESPRSASADLVAAFPVESVGQQEIDDLASVSAVNVQDKIIVTETRTQLEADSIASVTDGVEEVEVAEVAEIPTPAPELVVLVEETPGPEVPVTTYVAESAVEDAATQFMASESQAALEAEESCPTQPVETPSFVGIVPAIDTSAQAVIVGTEHDADQVPDLDIQPAVQGTIVQAAEADVSAATISAGQESEDVSPVEAEAQTVAEIVVSEAGILEIQAPTPVPEHAALADETPGPGTAAEAYESVEAAPAVVPVVSALEPGVEAIVEEAELPTRVGDMQPVETSSTDSVPEAVTAASATVDELIAVNVETQPTLDVPAEGVQIHTPATESTPIGVIPEFSIDKPAEPTPIAVTEEAQVLVEHAAPSASEPVATNRVVIIEEPVARDVQAPIEIEGPSSESTPQSVDEATNHPIVVVSTPEEIITVETEAQLEPAAVHPTADSADGTHAVAQDAEPDSIVSEVRVAVEATQGVVDVNEPETLAAEPEAYVPAPVEAEEPGSQIVVEAIEEGVVSRPDAAPVVEIDETSDIDRPQELVDLAAEQPAASKIEVSAQEPAGLSEEIVPVEL